MDETASRVSVSEANRACPAGRAQETQKVLRQHVFLGSDGSGETPVPSLRRYSICYSNEYGVRQLRISFGVGFLGIATVPLTGSVHGVFALI
jgi:hypothetical protein